MIRSMTGIGRAKGEIEKPLIRFEVEIRSYNHRFLDISLKLPGSFAPFEEEMRKLIQQRITRGHVVVVIQQDREILGNRFEVDQELLEAYLRVAGELKKKYKLSGALNINTLLAIPGLIKLSQCQKDTREIFNAFLPILKRALDEVIKAKKVEGNYIKTEILKLLEMMENELAQIARMIPERNEYYKKHLNELIKTAPGNLDQERLYQEVLYILDRTDVQEEYSRLMGHIKLFKEAIESDEHPGRRLNFLLQEMQREVNTLGVKAHFLEISKSVVDIKEIIEKIREQVQNIE